MLGSDFSGRLKRLLLWALSNWSVVIATMIYVVCMIYIVLEMHEHGKIFGLSETNLIEPEANDLMVFSFVLLLMSVSGFMMLVTIGASLINTVRWNREREKVWKKSGHQMRAIEACMDGIAILDAEGLYVYVNEAHARCYGFTSKEDMIGKSWRDMYTPRRAMLFGAEVFPHLEKHGEWSGQSEGRRIDGTEFPQEVSLKRLDDGGLICIVRDLSERMRADKLMRIIKLAVEAAADGIAITDEENKILFMNRSFLKIHGYDPYERDKYINTDWRLLYNQKGQEQINGTVLPTTILKGSWSGTITVMKKDSSLFYGDASLTRLTDGLILGVMRDVSDRRRAEIEREELKEQLFQSQKIEAIGRLTDRLVGDFQNILDAVAKAADNLRQDGISEDARKKEMDYIETEAQKAHDLVDQLRAFTRNKTVKAGRIDISKSVQDITGDLARTISSNIAVIADIKLPVAFVHATAEQIGQVIKNLCSNAIESIESKQGKIVLSVKSMERDLFGLRQYMMVDAAQDRGKAVSVRMKAASEGKHYLMTGTLVKGKQYIQITVSDTGRGIAPDILPNIFDPFFTTKALHKGTGLGLSTVQGTAVNAGGAVIVETTQDQGTSVHMFLPQSEVFEEAVPVLAA